MKPHLALSMMPEQPWLQAALPLLEAGVIDAIEWSFDCGWDGGEVPAWALELLDHFGAAERLYGHGVSYSMLTVEGPHHREWLEKFRAECSTRRYQHLTEHFGLMRTKNFHRGAPLPVPYDAALVALAGNRLRELREIAGCPVGLENLALAFTVQDVWQHARVIGEILAPAEGFYLVDLHNLYCQAMNFGISLPELFESYPRDRICELHVSGGSWVESDIGGDKRTVRRDTHDEAVPEAIFELLPKVLPLLPELRVVTFEQLSAGLQSDGAKRQFVADACRLRAILDQSFPEDAHGGA